MSNDYELFQQRLETETDLVRSWFKDKNFCSEGASLGYELEFCLVDHEGQPSPINSWFLQNAKDPHFVPELSRFNVELNGDPAKVEKGVCESLHRQVFQHWKKAQDCAESLKHHLVGVGILPSLTEESVQMNHLSAFQRYEALNRQILSLRGGKPFDININGHQSLKHQHPNLMLAAANTSLQIHLKVPYELSVKAMNASYFASVAMVALAANSPLLFGKDLWAETRIPLFEQSVDPVVRRSGPRQRTGFGIGYVKDSVLELFEENIKDFPILLPTHKDSDAEKLHHLNMHNGTIWRWNRPIIGFEKDGRPHVRLEHRVPSSGPTALDSTANILFLAGLVLGLAHAPEDLTKEIDFEDISQSFYLAAREGLSAKIKWKNGRRRPLRDLILEDWLPRAQWGLTLYGESMGNTKVWMRDIIEPRVRNGLTGSEWQRQWLRYHSDKKHRLQDLVLSYVHQQSTGKPVHEWNFGLS